MRRSRSHLLPGERLKAPQRDQSTGGLEGFLVASPRNAPRARQAEHAGQDADADTAREQLRSKYESVERGDAFLFWDRENSRLVKFSPGGCTNHNFASSLHIETSSYAESRNPRRYVSQRPQASNRTRNFSSCCHAVHRLGPLCVAYCFFL